MSQAPEDLLRSFELRAREQAERAALLSRRLEQASVVVESANGEVRLSVDSTGGLSGLTFGSAAGRLPLDRLAELVLQTSRRAQVRLAESMGAVVAQVYGDDSDTATFVSRVYAERFPSPEQDEEGERR